MTWWKSALGAVGIRPASKALAIRATRPRGGSTVLPELGLIHQVARIGGGLTPVQVSEIIRLADNGNMAPLMDLANEARQKDCHLQSVLATNEECIAGLKWELGVPDAPKRSEKKAADFVKEALEGLDMPRFLAHHAGAIFYGHAVTEIGWERIDGMLVPTSLTAHAPRRFAYALTTGRFHWWDQTTGMAYPGVDIRTEFPDRFVISAPRVNGDVPCREGLVRPLMWAALFRNWDLADWLKLAEIAWKPWRTASYKTGADQEIIDDLYQVLQAMTAGGIAVYPDTADLKIEWPTSSASTAKSTHSELFGILASEMSKAVLGQTETTDSSKSSGYAQAKVHNEVRTDLRDARAKAVASDVTRDLVRVMVRLNYGPTVKAPPFRLVTEDAQDLTAFATGVKTLVDAGMGPHIPVDWVLDEAGIPEAEDDDEVLGAQPVTGATPGPTSPDGSQESKPVQAPAQEAA